MAEIINLRRARKQKQREQKAEQADTNRVKFGRSKTEKQRAHRQQDDQARHVDGHKRDTPDDTPAT